MYQSCKLLKLEWYLSLIGYLFSFIFLIVCSGTKFNVKINSPCIINVETYIVCDLLLRVHFKIAIILFNMRAFFFYLSSIEIIPCRESRYNGSFKETYIYGAKKFGLQKYPVLKELKPWSISNISYKVYLFFS